uniref:Carbamoyl phosphate synthase small chain n=1 Tax=Chondria sp. (in: red algae) TaxID=1982705 RepID=A0A1Z1MCD0_9FLOR|nr:carbamoyl phosphate synthase small subunit [Chondria sp. (in: red algae)]
MSNNLYPVVLYLEDGMFYKGWSFFKLSTYFGEIVFNTGMTGYQEILTDPSYSGQMVVFTYPELGNTGLNSQDNESSIVHVKALIVKNVSNLVNNWRSVISLKDFLIQKRLPHILGIDTRALTRHVRSCGVMNAVIFHPSVHISESNFLFNSIDKINLISKVTTKGHYFINNKIMNFMDKSKSVFNFKSNISSLSSYVHLKILVVDFGVKLNILKQLLHLGCLIVVVPANCTYEKILQYKPDAILLSNGPGNPASASFSINIVKKLIYFANIPIFGICMGHQILNLALGADTFKLKFGHRGLNHPSGCLSYSEVTSQNHGFAVYTKSLLANELFRLIECKFFNLNDLTIATTLHKSNPIFSVQYHPEASPGPRDSSYLFNTFIELVNLIKLKVE